MKHIENYKNVWKKKSEIYFLFFILIFVCNKFHDRLYPALKLLEQLETKHLVLVKEHRWSELIQHNIAKFRSQIRNESHNELKNFLENVATHADKIGKSAFAQVNFNFHGIFNIYKCILHFRQLYVLILIDVIIY